MPHIQITNNNSTTLNLSDIVLEYFIYEPELSVSSLSWRNDWCKVGSNTNATSAYTISFSRLDTAYTDGAKKADIKLTLSFSEGYSLAPTEMAEIHFAFYRNDWQYNFNEVTHWSWKNSSTFIDADSTVLRSTDESCESGECISFGVQPPTAAAISSVYPEDCGAGENMKLDGYVRNGKKGGPTKYGTISSSDYCELNKRSLLFNVDPGSAITSSSRWITAKYALDGILIENIEYPEGRKAVSITENGLSTTGAVICMDASVNGLLRAKEIRVTNNGWSDYIFEDNYKLRTLAETEDFIKVNGHLPNIKSGASIGDAFVDFCNTNIDNDGDEWRNARTVYSLLGVGTITPQKDKMYYDDDIPQTISEFSLAGTIYIKSNIAIKNMTIENNGKEYGIEANGDIIIKPETHFENGSEIHLVVE